MLFNKMIFVMTAPETYVKTQMNGLSDPTIRDFCPLSLIPVYKHEHKKKLAWEEYVASYVDAAKVLAEGCSLDQASPIIMEFKKHSPVVPCLFLCRHAIELAIKAVITNSGKEIIPKHSLPEQWQELTQSLDFGNKADEAEKTCVEEMGAFIELMASLDNEKSTKLRYPVDKFGKESHSDFVFVALKHIVNTTELFVNQLYELSISGRLTLNN